MKEIKPGEEIVLPHSVKEHLLDGREVIAGGFTDNTIIVIKLVDAKQYFNGRESCTKN